MGRDSRRRTLKLAELRFQVLLLAVVALIFSVATAAQCNFPAKTMPDTVTYTFDPAITDGKLVFYVTLQFQGSRSGREELVLPSTWAGEINLADQTQDLKATSPGTIILPGLQPGTKIVKFPPSTLVAISYALAKDWTGPFQHPKEFRAILEPAYFEFNTENALVHPLLSDNQIADVRFDWQKLPSSWSLATSFGEGDRCQSFRGPWYRVNEALFAGGDFRIHRFSVAGQTQVFVFRGKWKFTDDDLMQRIRKILAAEKDFWHDNDFPYFMVTLSPFDDLNGSTDGSRFTNAFWLFMPQGQTLSHGIQNTLAHEIFHTWNPGKMGIPSSPEAPEKWLTEGFTVYYSDLMLLRPGLLSLPDYLHGLNRQIADYEFSPIRNISNSEIVARYHDDREVNHFPYVRGPILALWLDAQIRADSGGKQSLDSLMLQLVQGAASAPRLGVTNQRIFQTTAKYLSTRSQRELRALVESGKDIAIPSFPQGTCVTLSNDPVGKFELGFARNAMEKKSVIEGVIPDSNAYAAGVRDGQQLLGEDIYWDDQSKAVHLTVRTADGVKTIEYLPQGKLSLIPQYHLNQNTSQKNSLACSN